MSLFPADCFDAAEEERILQGFDRNANSATVEHEARLAIEAAIAARQCATHSGDDRWRTRSPARRRNRRSGQPQRPEPEPVTWPNMRLETRRAILEHLTTEIRFAGDDIELVIRPELRRMIAAIAAPRSAWRTARTATTSDGGLGQI